MPQSFTDSREILLGLLVNVWEVFEDAVKCVPPLMHIITCWIKRPIIATYFLPTAKT